MPFEPGHQKIEGSGRRKGQVGVRAQLAAETVRSAIQICREGGTDPISIMVNAARMLNTITAALAPSLRKGASEDEIRAAIRAVPAQELERLRKFIETAAGVAHKAAEFGYAKLQRIDYAGDAPAVASVENKMLFVLNLDSARPGRPVTTINGNGSAHEEEEEVDDDGDVR